MKTTRRTTVYAGVVSDVSKVHDGGTDQDILTDSSESWVVNSFVGGIVYNETDGSSGEITANTATTVTATLSGGTDDNWDDGDRYRVETRSPILDVRGMVTDKAILMLDDNGTGSIWIEGRRVPPSGAGQWERLQVYSGADGGAIEPSGTRSTDTIYLIATEYDEISLNGAPSGAELTAGSMDLSICGRVSR